MAEKSAGNDGSRRATSVQSEVQAGRSIVGEGPRIASGSTDGEDARDSRSIGDAAGQSGIERIKAARVDFGPAWRIQDPAE